MQSSHHFLHFPVRFGDAHGGGEKGQLHGAEVYLLRVRGHRADFAADVRSSKNLQK